MAGLNIENAPAQTVIGGVLPVMSLASTLAQRDAQNKQLAAAEVTPVVNNLAAYVRGCWEDAKAAKRDVEERMLAAMRARRGEYDPEVKQAIKDMGGSEIYMMLFATKARQLGALLRDTLVGSGAEKPWTLTPTAQPDIPPDEMQAIWFEALSKVQMAEMAGLPMDVEQVRAMLRDMREVAQNAVRTEAVARCQRMEIKMEDQLQEGGWLEVLDQLIDDLSVFPTIVMKGPVVRKRSVLSWVPTTQGKFELAAEEKMRLEWDRVSPFDIYPARGSSGPDDKFIIERHPAMSRAAYEALIGVDGYSEAAIRSMLADHGGGGLKHWLWTDAERAQLESGTAHTWRDGNGIEAIQFWGPVSGRMLVDWGMDESRVPDPDKEYEAEVWLVGPYVIRCTLNTDPLFRRPYYTTGFERVPGAFWHNSLFDVIRDVCAMCNSAARALANNMGISSGPQVVVNVDRMPAGASITSLYPWKIHQVKDNFGSTSLPPVDFFQPSSNAAELMAVYEKFSVMADEHSGLPRYMTGGEGAGGAGRTASGLAMMVANASKTVKSLVANIDVYLTAPSIKRLYFYNMRYLDDPDLKGDVNVVARGALSLVTKESAQVRRIEFLARTANPFDMPLIGAEGRAYLLRETARSLDLDVDRVVPTTTARQISMLQQAMADPTAGAAPGGAPMGGQPVAGPGQDLIGGAPVTDNFTPQPQ